MAMKVFLTNFLLNERILMKFIDFKTFSSKYILLFFYFPSTVLHFGEKIKNKEFIFTNKKNPKMDQI